MHQKDQERDGCPPPNRLAGPGERRELPQRGPGRSPDRQRIFGIFEAHSTLQPQALRPNKDSYFFRKKIHSIDDWGAWPLGLPLATPLGGNTVHT